jgi:hypothetical protein
MTTHPSSFAVRSFGLAVALVALAASTASMATEAGMPTTPSQAFEQQVDNRQGRQEQRIEQGVANGSLTRREARRLGKEQAGVVRAENRAEADGRVTRREAARLERRQDAASRHIYRHKHDRQVRTPQP